VQAAADLVDDATDAALVVPATATRPRLDLGRELHCLLGLVFDAITLDEAVRRVRRCAREATRCFVSTPNVNFAIAAQRDAAFRDSVLHSDLSLADGMPIVWLARWLGVPVTERVAGSDLFERLVTEPGQPLGVYFFGGAPGVAAAAGERLNARAGGLRCVGHESPGFGSVEEMSSAAQIERINASGADFVVVALGAKKGQAWIERNRARLSAPLISHLGAVVNFAGGTVLRAPRWAQRTGLEWLWRIKEEPALWQRYLRDGIALAGIVATRVLPRAARARWKRAEVEACEAGSFELVPDAGAAVLRLRGTWTSNRLAPLRRELARLLREGRTVQVDIEHVTRVDSALPALLLLVDRWQVEPAILRPVERLHPEVKRSFFTFGAPLPTRPAS
jgi:N-acetylglucosaminyldiphosphoundecaprenol N-acetyl-beta-D-mannosaminyltransferase